jgi:hypothetical protein
LLVLSISKLLMKYALFIFCTLIAAAQEPASTLYVATNGNDAWSGRLAEPNAAGTDGPVRSIAAARDRIRAARTAKPSSVLIREGRYEISEPIVFTPEDSGHSGRPIVYAAYPGERCVISGGRKITGWVKREKNLWTAEIPEVRAGHWRFRQLIVNGRRAVRARSPNKGYYRIEGPKSDARPFEIRYRGQDIHPGWAALGDVEVIALFGWADVRMPIRKVDDVRRVATLAGDARPSNTEADARYWIENAPEALDETGEWYVDRKTGVLSYLAWPGQDLTKLEAIAPIATRLVELDGEPSSGKLVHHIVLRGLEFQDAGWDLGPDGYADVQAAFEIGSALKLTGATDCVIEQCTICGVEGYALDLGRGSKRNQIVGNRIFDTGAGGIKLGWGSENRQPVQSSSVVFKDEIELNGDNLVSDNHIFDLGKIYPSAVGIWMGQSINSKISHNHIHDLNYTAISVGWTWGYAPQQCQNNSIEYNHLHDIGRGMLSDLGAIYTLGVQPGTVIRNNLIHDVSCFAYGAGGIYLDEGSSDILLEHNVVYGTETAALMQNYGRNNTIRNNIFALSKDCHLLLGIREDHLSLVFERNIVYWDQGILFAGNWSVTETTPPCGVDSTSYQQHPDTGCRHFRADFNTYYRVRSGSPAFAGASFEQWKQRGCDVHSIIADPDFVAVHLYNFALRPGSPALKQGFQPIDLSTVGPRPGRLPNEGPAHSPH